MIGPDPLTQFILYMFYGFMTRDEAGQGKRLMLFKHGIMWLFTRCVRPCIFMLENAGSVILNEMTNYHLCMKPVKTSNNGCRLKRLRG